jgi:DNA-binding response OmpR family regulator
VALPQLGGSKSIGVSGRRAASVILLTALRDEENVVQGFQAGADHYVTKPFSLRQVAMHTRADRCSAHHAR